MLGGLLPNNIQIYINQVYCEKLFYVDINTFAIVLFAASALVLIVKAQIEENKW